MIEIEIKALDGTKLIPAKNLFTDELGLFTLIYDDGKCKNSTTTRNKVNYKLYIYLEDFEGRYKRKKLRVSVIRYYFNFDSDKLNMSFDLEPMGKIPEWAEYDPNYFEDVDIRDLYTENAY